MPDLAVPVGDTDLPAYLALPPVGTGPWPAVVVVHDAFGLTDHTREHADRLAAAGYVAVVPDLYGRGSAARCVRQTFRELGARRGRPSTTSRPSGAGRRPDPTRPARWG